MWTPTALGTAAAYLFSLAALVVPAISPASPLGPGGRPPVHFEAA